MEIEVGEYVRTKKYGDIGKLLKITNTKVYLDSIGYPIDRNEIAKHSKEPIDLVEVKDIVHTKDVLHEDITYIWSEEYLKALKEDIQNGIKLVSIVTHEQFESVEYKVEEEK